MATETPAVLYKEWQCNELGVGRAVDQLLQHLVEQSERLAELENGYARWSRWWGSKGMGNVGREL